MCYTGLHSPIRSYKVGGKSWQTVTAIHDEGDCLTICEWYSLGYDCTHCCCVNCGFAQTQWEVCGKSWEPVTAIHNEFHMIF
jgi:hypothetical protein